MTRGSVLGSVGPRPALPFTWLVLQEDLLLPRPDSQGLRLCTSNQIPWRVLENRLLGPPAGVLIQQVQAKPENVHF